MAKLVTQQQAKKTSDSKKITVRKAIALAGRSPVKGK